jgi:hypothetical protein
MGAAEIDKDSAGGPRRVRDLLSIVPLVSAENTAWRIGETFATATPASDLIELVADALRTQYLELDGGLTLVRHRPGDRGLPAGGENAAVRFAIDLTDSPRTLSGGVLMFVDDAGRVQGWRAEASALTVWAGADPELTELAPGAPERLTLVGQANPRRTQP